MSVVEPWNRTKCKLRHDFRAILRFISSFIVQVDINQKNQVAVGLQISTGIPSNSNRPCALVPLCRGSGGGCLGGVQHGHSPSSALAVHRGRSPLGIGLWEPQSYGTCPHIYIYI